MTGYLLDTNVVSELTVPAPHPNVTAFFAVQDDLWLASVVVYELEFGLHLVPPGRRHDRLSLANSRIMAAFGDRVLPLSRSAAEWAARFRADTRRQGRALKLADALIAGTAMANDLPVVTRDVRDFSGLGVEVINPWEYETT